MFASHIFEKKNAFPIGKRLPKIFYSLLWCTIYQSETAYRTTVNKM